MEIGRRMLAASRFYTGRRDEFASHLPLIRTRIRKALQQRAERLFPGGVNSPVRAFRAVGGDPPFIERAEGAYLFDADGNRYIDYFGSWGPMILGHAFPPVVEAIERAARNSRQLRRIHRRRGRSRRAHRCLLSGHREDALRQLRHRSHHVGHPRGPRRHRPQASSSSSRAAITATPTGCWSKPAPALPPSAFPARPACPKRSRSSLIALPYNDLAAVEAAFAAHPDEIAAIIVEPIVGNAGCIPPAARLSRRPARSHSPRMARCSSSMKS